MDSTITTDNSYWRAFVAVAALVAMMMIAAMFFATNERIARYTNANATTTTTTMQWSADSSWTKGGWK